MTLGPLRLRLASSPSQGHIRSERLVVLLLAAVNFANILDFMMVMPLGPDLALGLGLSANRVGLLGAAYTGAAAVAGLICATFLDRFDRRMALCLLMVGLGLGTLGGALAWDVPSLVASRLVAGAFGGPATAASYALVADLIPVERRGRAMAVVMGAFAAASVLGVPLGLGLAGMFTWRAPFAAVGALAILLGVVSFLLLPPMRGHVEAAGRATVEPLRLTPVAWMAFAAVGLNQFATFSLLPNLASWLLFNVGWPREHLDLLYMVGGLSAFAMMHLAGRATDALGSPVVSAFGASLAGGVMCAAFVPSQTLIHPVFFFVLLMSANACRSVSGQALLSQVPAAAERARFNALLSAVQHVSAAAGASFSSMVLAEDAHHRLIGLDVLAGISLCLFLAVPVLFATVARRLAQRPSARELAA